MPRHPHENAPGHCCRGAFDFSSGELSDQNTLNG